MNTTIMNNLTDDEIIRHVDRTNPEIWELCARIEELIAQLEEARSEIALLDPKEDQEEK